MKSTTTTTIGPFAQLTPALALEQLMAARTGTIALPKGDKKIDKLLEIAPIIFLENGMKTRSTGKTPDFESAYLPKSQIGNRAPTDEVQLIFILEQGIIMQSKLGRGSTPEFLPPQNIATLTSTHKDNIGQKERLVEYYEKALNHCDSMLIVFYCGIMRARGLSQYMDFVARLETELHLGRNAIKHMLLSIPGTFLSTGENDLLYDTNHSLVGRRVRLPWLEGVRDVGSLCVLIPLDHSILDIDTSSFHILASGAKSFKNPDALILHIMSIKVPAVIQLYRLGKLVMDAPRTEAVIKFLLNAELIELGRLNHRELVLMGGVLSRDRVVAVIEQIVESMLKDSSDDVANRCGLLFCYLSSLSIAPHCVIDIIDRKAEYNVAKYLLSSVKGKRELNISLKTRLSKIAFSLMNWLMEIDATRLHLETLETFTEYKYLIQVDVSRPARSPHLDIFKKRYMLTSRFYVASHKDIGIKDITTYNDTNSIVLLSEEEVKSNVPRYDSSIYIIYDEDGEVIPDIRDRNTGMDQDDEFSLLETHSLTELRAAQDGSRIIQQIQDIFSERRSEMLKVAFEPTEGYAGLYTANLDGIALEHFTRRVREATAPRAKQLRELTIEKKEELFRPQMINLLQEKPIRTPGKNGSEDLHYFLTPRQLRILGRAVVSIKQLKQEKEALQTQLSTRSTHASTVELEEDIARIDKEMTQWINMILRIPSSSELYGKATIERMLKEANILKGMYNSPAARRAQAARPGPKGKRRGKAKPQTTMETAENTDTSSHAEDEPEVAPQTDTQQANQKSKPRKGGKNDGPTREEILSQKAEKFNAAQSRAERAKEEKPMVKEESIETRLLKAQEPLTDLIRFATNFEMALAKFIGVNNKGPLTEEYLSNAETVVNEKLSQLHSQKQSSVESILMAYKARDTKHPIIKYKPDFSRYERIVPDKDFIKKHYPAYFALGPTQIPSMVIRSDEGEQPRFGALNLLNDEIVVMARLEKDWQRRVEFNDLIAVLYHMLRDIDTHIPAQLEAHTTIFRRMIAEASTKGKTQV